MRQDITRNEFRKAILALLIRTFEETKAADIAACEKLSAPFDREERERQKELISLVVEPFVSYLSEEIDENGFTSLLIESFLEKFRQKGGNISALDEQKIVAMNKRALRSVVYMMLPGCSLKRALEYINKAVYLSKKYRKTLEEICISESYHHEILRLMFNAEEYRKVLHDMVSKILEKETIEDLFLRPIACSLGISSDEIDELLAEFDFQEEYATELERIREVYLQIFDEKIYRIYGE